MSHSVCEPLGRASIWAGLSQKAQHHVVRLDVVESTESTNTELMQRPIPPAGASEVLLAEAQTAGRGRRGRNWLTTPGSALCLSLSWTFQEMPRSTSALSLAIGVCVLRALTALGVRDTRLKWPNDILLRDRKLGGILIELRSEAGAPAGVVIGIGLNMALADDLAGKIAELGLPAADLSSSGYGSVSRNALAAELIEACMDGLLEFEREGLRPFIDEWGRADGLYGQQVVVQSAEESSRGIARGVDLTGAFIIETNQGLKKFISGEVTVRIQA
jgi:BirA family biotin operon repressor/biotin-[acetyl-CoA-carboxylase] ligase